MNTPISRENITPRVITIIRECLGIPSNVEIDDETSIPNDLGSDSLDCTEIGFTCEDEFKVEIADHDMAEIETVGDLIDLILEAGPVA